MLCPNGHPNRDGARFCRVCGVPMSRQPAKKKSSKSGVIAIVAVVLAVLAGIGMMANADKPESAPSVEKPVITPPAAPEAPAATEAPVVPEFTVPPVTLAPPTEPDNYIAEINGRFESVRIQDGSSTLNVHAFVFYKKLERCEELTLHMNVEMQNGTKCYDWNVWVRRNGTFEKYTKLYLPGGDGALQETIYFSTPATIDAIVVTPTAAGDYSWKMSMGISDVWLDK